MSAKDPEAALIAELSRSSPRKGVGFFVIDGRFLVNFNNFRIKVRNVLHWSLHDKRHHQPLILYLVLWVQRQLDLVWETRFVINIFNVVDSSSMSLTISILVKMTDWMKSWLSVCNLYCFNTQPFEIFSKLNKISEYSNIFIWLSNDHRQRFIFLKFDRISKW